MCTWVWLVLIGHRRLLQGTVKILQMVSTKMGTRHSWYIDTLSASNKIAFIRRMHDSWTPDSTPIIRRAGVSWSRYVTTADRAITGRDEITDYRWFVSTCHFAITRAFYFRSIWRQISLTVTSVAIVTYSHINGHQDLHLIAAMKSLNIATYTTDRRNISYQTIKDPK